MIVDFEDCNILPDGYDETRSKISNEMKAIDEMLRDIKKSRGCAGCLPLPECEHLDARFHRLQISSHISLELILYLCDVRQ